MQSVITAVKFDEFFFKSESWHLLNIFKQTKFQAFIKYFLRYPADKIFFKNVQRDKAPELEITQLRKKYRGELFSHEDSIYQH